MPNFDIFYMNQGGKGQWGGIDYRNYHLLLLAESQFEEKKKMKEGDTDLNRWSKNGFSTIYHTTDSRPTMTIQLKKNLLGQRFHGRIEDHDVTREQVRPVLSLPLTKTRVGGSPIKIIFVHLKSANVRQANDALSRAAWNMSGNDRFGQQPILWIGDFNRASPQIPIGQYNQSARLLFAGGGQSKWPLDRVYYSGDWGQMPPGYKIVTQAGADHGHLGIHIRIRAQ